MKKRTFLLFGLFISTVFLFIFLDNQQSSVNMKSYDLLLSMEIDAKYLEKTTKPTTDVYVIGAYQLNDQLIRVILIANCSLNIRLLASTSAERNNIINGNLSLMNKKCPVNDHPACRFAGFYAEFLFPQNTKFDGNRMILRRESSENEITVTLLRSLPASQRIVLSW